MKVLAGNTSVMVKPDLGIGEESLNAIDVGSSTNVFLLAVQDPVMSSAKGENAISLKVIGMVDAAPSGMFQDEGYESGPSSVGHREGDNFTISLIHPKYQLLSFGPPASFALSSPAKERLIQLKLSGESLHLGKRSVVDSLPEEPKGSVGGGEVVGKVKPCPVAWNPQAEEVKKMGDLIEGEAELSQVGAGKIGKRIAAAGAPESLISSPKLSLSAPGTDPSSIPSELDKKSSTFWQASSQGNCLFCKHKNIISQYQICRNHLNLSQTAF